MAGYGGREGHAVYFLSKLIESLIADSTTHTEAALHLKLLASISPATIDFAPDMGMAEDAAVNVCAPGPAVIVTPLPTFVGAVR